VDCPGTSARKHGAPKRGKTRSRRTSWPSTLWAKATNRGCRQGLQREYSQRRDSQNHYHLLLALLMISRTFPLGVKGKGLNLSPQAPVPSLGASTAHFAQVSPSILQETASPPPRGGFFEKGRELNLLSGEISGNSVNFWESPSRWRSKERARGLYPIFFGWELLGQNWKKTSGEGKFTGKANYPGGKPGPLSIREAGENTFSERSVSHGAVRNSCKGPLLV